MAHSEIVVTENLTYRMVVQHPDRLDEDEILEVADTEFVSNPARLDWLEKVRDRNFAIEDQPRLPPPPAPPCPGCAGAAVPGVVVASGSVYGIRRCPVCPLFASDLLAAAGAARWLGRGEVRFWQHDPYLARTAGESPSHRDLTALGVRPRTYYPRASRAGDAVLAHTYPWIEVRGHPVDWYSISLGLAAHRR